jgi:hypothetical protein
MKKEKSLGVFAPLFSVGDILIDHTHPRTWKDRLFSWPWRPFMKYPRYKITKFVGATVVEVEYLP